MTAAGAPHLDGWCSVEDLTRYAFAQARVVMANEAHNGLARCVRTREIGARIVRAAHESGVRRMAMEALPVPADGTLGPIRVVPDKPGGYLAQPEMRRLIGTALELGWTLWAYEAAIPPDADPAELVGLEFTNRREQAVNLCRVVGKSPGGRCSPGAATATPRRRRPATGSRWDTISRRFLPPLPSSSIRP